jgi:two-component system nitrogen regulation response regulator NtrX
MSEGAAYRASVLVVDDEASIRESLRMILEYEGYRVDEAASGSEALTKIAVRRPSALLLDIKMPQMDGLALLSAVRERGYSMPVLMISGHGNVASAVEATRLGAYDFLEKPLQRDRVLLGLRNAIEGDRLQQENQRLKPEHEEIVGTSSAIRSLLQTVKKAAPTNATVLIRGESGTGKELVARAVHEHSQRADRALVKVNCAAIPEDLIESELFGHEKGSFTGASRRQIGKFVAADGGTIFLDEIGDMSARTQAKVLRVLQDGEVEPVGAAAVHHVDVRVVAATHRDLEVEIAEGRFREDLFYRLNVLPIQTPALREHSEDVPVLVAHFVRRFARENNSRERTFTEEAMEALSAMPWRGNVRELKNSVDCLLILSPGGEIGREAVLSLGAADPQELPSAMLSVKTLKDFRERSERSFLVHKLEDLGWNVTKTAQAIETPRSNLYKKMDQYEIRRRRPGKAEDE